MRLWSDNPLARYLIGSPARNLRRNLIRTATLSAVLILLLSALFVVLNRVGLSMTLACPIWLIMFIFPGMVAARARLIANDYIGTGRFEMVRLTALAPRQIIEGFGLASLYRMRRLAALIYGALPGLILATLHIHLWISMGGIYMPSGAIFEPLVALRDPVVLLRIPILLGMAVSTVTVMMPSVANNLWVMMSRNRAEFKPIAADMGVALSFFGLTIAQIIIPFLAMGSNPAARNQTTTLLVTVLLIVLVPFGHWLLTRWMLRMADERL